MTATSCYRFRCRWTGKKVLVTFHEFLLKHAPDFSHVPTVAKELVGEDESCWLGRFGRFFEGLKICRETTGKDERRCHWKQTYIEFVCHQFRRRKLNSWLHVLLKYCSRHSFWFLLNIHGAVKKKRYFDTVFFWGNVDPKGAENETSFLRNDVENMWRKAVKVKGNQNWEIYPPWN